MSNKKADPEEVLPDDPRPPYSNWSDYLLGLDMYGVSPTLEIKGKKVYRSWIGAGVSAGLIVVMVLYSLQKLNLVNLNSESDDLNSFELEFTKIEEMATNNWYLIKIDENSD